MPVYEFGNQYAFVNTPRALSPVAGVVELDPHISMNPPAMSQISNIDNQVANTWEKGRVGSIQMVESLDKGFHYLDEAMKAYWSDLRIPSKDFTRFLRTKIAGASKAVQVWTEDLKNGRVILPVMSISRGSHTFNPEKFSPAYHPMAMRFLNGQRTLIKKIFRPVPYLVEYTMTILAEHKRDAEYALAQVINRFNPLAEFEAFDGHIRGVVTLRPGTSQDQSDKEASADQWAKIKYEITTTVEAWLSLPEQVIPTVINLRGGYRIEDDMINYDRFKIVK